MISVQSFIYTILSVVSLVAYSTAILSIHHFVLRGLLLSFKFRTPKKTSYATVVIQCGGGSDMSLKIPWMIRKKWKEFVSEQIKNGE